MVLVLSLTIGAGSNAFASELHNVEDVARAEISEYVSEQYSSLSNLEQSELTEEIYQEKYAEAMTINDEVDEEFIDIAYQNMITRETYIAELINSYSGIETTVTDWKYNLEYLKKHYDDLMAVKDVNKVYVDLYIEDYEIVQNTVDMP